GKDQQHDLRRLENRIRLRAGFEIRYQERRSCARHESADMRGIVDPWNRKADDQIDHNHRKNPRTDRPFKMWWNRVSVAKAEHEEHTKQSKDRTRSPGGWGVGMIEVASHYTGDAGQHIQNDEARASVDLLDLGSDDPQRVRVE